MLVLTRGIAERIVIQTPAGDVTLTVIDVRTHTVKLGFEAPREVPIHRAEILEPRRKEAIL